MVHIIEATIARTPGFNQKRCFRWNPVEFDLSIDSFKRLTCAYFIVMSCVNNLLAEHEAKCVWIVDMANKQ